MKILVTGDKHLGLVSEGVSRLDEPRRVLRGIEKILEEEAPDVYVDLGDLFHSPRPSPETVAVAISHFATVAESQARLTAVLVGNHDKPTRGADLHALLPLVQLRRYGFPRVIDRPRAIDLDDVRFVFLPYVRECETAGVDVQSYLDDVVAEFLEVRRGTRIVAFAHLEVPGAKTSPDDVSQREIGIHVPRALLEDDRVVRVFAGHIHHYQKLDRVTVVGSSIYVDFGEALSSKGCVLAEV